MKSPTDREKKKTAEVKNNNFLYIRKYSLKHKRIIVISISVLLFIGASLAIFCK